MIFSQGRSHQSYSHHISRDSSSNSDVERQKRPDPTCDYVTVSAGILFNVRDKLFGRADSAPGEVFIKSTWWARDCLETIVVIESLFWSWCRGSGRTNWTACTRCTDLGTRTRVKTYTERQECECYYWTRCGEMKLSENKTLAVSALKARAY